MLLLAVGHLLLGTTFIDILRPLPWVMTHLKKTNMLEITTQNVDTWKKRIRRHGLKGSTYLCNASESVWVSASGEHQELCQKVLGPPNGKSSLPSYIRWNNVMASDIVNLLYHLDNG